VVFTWYDVYLFVVTMKRVLVCILDGFGYREERYGNAAASSIFVNELMKDGRLLAASEEGVGLPSGQCGNSEVGHLTIGSGRIVKQRAQLIDDSIRSGRMEANNKLYSFVGECKNNTCHLLGLFSDGRVHSSISHFFWAVKFLRSREINIKCHLIFDGRDVGYRDGLSTLRSALMDGDLCHEEIATIQGRFYAMDRDRRVERTQAAHDLIVSGVSEHGTSDPLGLIRKFYDLGIHDEVLPPIAVNGYSGAPLGSSLWNLNFRADRVVQMLSSLLSSGFKVLSMVNCKEKADDNLTILFEDFSIKNTLGEVLSKNGVKQLRIAETEKYAHITYFLNGGKDIQYDLEDRILIPSPRVDDYAKTPGMSAKLISDEIVRAMLNQSHDVIVANFANADLVGHTGDFEATKLSIAILDEEVRRLAKSADANGFDMIITADHGNADMMINSDGTPNKTHTCSVVPFIHLPCSGDLRGGTLADIAPTLLWMLDIGQPSEMTGRRLLI
jgi:2,3-bisphosphoglycerate-independent phosphoglycerate mutase